MTTSERSVSDTASLLERARAHLPGGGIWTFSARPSGFGSTLDVPDFLIERGQGAYVWTTDGERLLDLVLGSGTVLVGHAHPEIVAAAAAQIAKGANYSHLSPPVRRARGSDLRGRALCAEGALLQFGYRGMERSPSGRCGPVRAATRS